MILIDKDILESINTLFLLRFLNFKIIDIKLANHGGAKASLGECADLWNIKKCNIIKCLNKCTKKKAKKKCPKTCGLCKGKKKHAMLLVYFLDC